MTSVRLRTSTAATATAAAVLFVGHGLRLPDRLEEYLGVETGPGALAFNVTYRQAEGTSSTPENLHMNAGDRALGDAALRRLVSDLRSYGDLADGWDGEDAKPPTREHIGLVEALLSKLPSEVPVPRPMISSTGALGLYWDAQQRYADLEIEATGEVSLFTRRTEGEHDEEVFLEGSFAEGAGMTEITQALRSLFA